MSVSQGSGRPSPEGTGFIARLFRLPVENTKYLWLLAGLFPLSIVLSNILATAKLIQLTPELDLGWLVVPGMIVSAGTILFPIMYIFSDTITEVYGYPVCRKMIWLGFLGMLGSTGMILFVYYLPSPSFWTDDAAYATMFLSVWRICLGSLVAYIAGEFVNSYVLARMKLAQSREDSNKGMARRFILSTVVGQLIDTALFTVIAFAGTRTNEQLLVMALSGWLFKVAWEIVALPFTLPLVRWLKRVEGIDHFAENISFNPLSLDD